MGLFEARGNLNKSYKDLMNRWMHIKETWDDEQSEMLEKETLERLAKDLKTAVDAIDTMALVCGSAKRDCSPTEG
jgi:predicted transcriptional regulator